MNSLFDLSALSINGEPVNFLSFQGQVVLVVNVASACGFTDQYAGLEKLHQDHKAQGLVVLGFPCNQFGAQEPGSEAEIESFCQVNFGVTFPLFSKIDVNGANAHPAYAWLKQNCPDGQDDIGWNFNKFLINREGMPTQRFGADVEPEALRTHIEALL